MRPSGSFCPGGISGGFSGGLSDGDLDRGGISYGFGGHGGTSRGDNSHGGTSRGGTSCGGISYGFIISHGGISHGFISHGGISHGFISHGGIYSHGDISSHGVSSHGGISSDISHGDISFHGGISHGGISHGFISHGDISNGISHGHIVSGGISSHGDISHDGGISSHGVSSHGDISLQDISHGDISHGGISFHGGISHGDISNGVSHGHIISGGISSHGDISHGFISNGDGGISHGGTSHGDISSHGVSSHGGTSSGISHGFISNGGISNGDGVSSRGDISHGGISGDISHGHNSHGGISNGISHGHIISGGLSSHGGISHGGISHGFMSNGGISNGDGDISHGDISHGGISSGVSRAHVSQDGDRDDLLRGGSCRGGTCGGIGHTGSDPLDIVSQDSDTSRGGGISQDLLSHTGDVASDGDTSRSRVSRPGGISLGGGTSPGGTFCGGISHGDTSHEDAFHGGTSHGGSSHSDISQGGGISSSGTSPGGISHDDTSHGATSHGATSQGDATFHCGTFHGVPSHGATSQGDATSSGGTFHGATSRGAPSLLAPPPPGGSSLLLGLSHHPRWPPRHLHHLLLVVLVLLLLSPCPTLAATFKVGVLGPWSCDPLLARALPEVASRLAVARLNRDPDISGGFWWDAVVLPEACQTPQAVTGLLNAERYATGLLGPLNPAACRAAGLLAAAWNKPLAAWTCLGDAEGLDTLVVPMPEPVEVLHAVLRYFRWAHVAVVAAPEDLWREVGLGLAQELRAKGLPVSVVATAGADEDEAGEALRRVRRADGVRVVVMCMHSVLLGGEEQRVLLEKAEDMGMTDGTYVFVPYDALTFPLPYRGRPYPVLANNTKLRLAYDAVLTVTIDSPEVAFHEALDRAKAAYEIPTHIDPMQVHPLFATIYNSIFFLAKAVEATRQSGRWVMGTSVAANARGFRLDGFCQSFSVDEDGAVNVPYVVLDTDGKGDRLWPVYGLEPGTRGLGYRGHSVHWPHSSSPGTDSGCWFESGTICNGGMDATFVLLMFLLVSALVAAGAALACFIRRRLQEAQLMKGPNKIILTMEDLTFIHTQSSKKVDGSRTSLAGRSGGDAKSLVAGPDNTNMAIAEGSENPKGDGQLPLLLLLFNQQGLVASVQGDWVWLKKFPGDQHSEVKPATKLAFCKLRDLRHENVNLFLGFFHDCGIFAIVSEHCSRGSLQDLLLNQDMKLDWMFKSSLLIDLIKGVRYLHHRGVVHGRLKSRNCVVDGRFVLKVTDHGYNELLEAQRLPAPQPQPHERLWTAPELLRDAGLERRGSQRGDVFGVGIIMQEVVCRSAPYCMLGLPPEEIIEKVARPPPLCRPAVSADQAPLECIHLMKQCWAEQPDKRPNIDQVFDQFKSINKGRKTNIIDSMLRMLEQYSSNLEDLIRERTEELEIEKQKTDRLLTQMLPPWVPWGSMWGWGGVPAP